MKKLALCFLIFYAAATTRLSAQATDCNDPSASLEANAVAQQQWENGSSPVYDDANELAITLNERGFHVQCIRRTVTERFFLGQKGAAQFKADQGIFDVWSLPKNESFAGLEVDEQREIGRYLYSFRGTPQILRTMDSSKQTYFIRYENLLFVIWGDERLATNVQNAFQWP